MSVNKIIHTASAAAGAAAAGMAQLPGSDVAVLTPIQVMMAIAIADHYGLKLDEGAATGLISSLGAGVIGRGISQFMVGWIPGIGNAINATTAAGVTEALGWAIDHEMRREYEMDQE